MAETFEIGVGCADISEKEKEYVNDALNSNRISYGKYARRFEKDFARLHNRKFAMMCNSGTSALRVAVACLKEVDNWQDGDEVIVPAVTFIASSNVVIQNGLKPVFVDVDSKTYNLDPAKIEAKITKKTRAIIPVHLFGMPCDMEPIMKIAKEHKLRIIEDSCETMFVKYKGKPAGSFGDIACFSTYVAHLLVTGVGGIAATDDEKLAVVMRSLMNHGRDSIYITIDDDANKDAKELSMIMSRRFSFVRLGYSFRATEMECALGCGQLEIMDRILSARQKNGKYLTEKLSKFRDFVQLPSIPSDREHAFMMFPIVVKDPRIRRDDLTLFLEQNGIETRYMLPLLNQPIYVKLFGNLEDKYPVAKNINRNGFYIGCHQKLSKQELDYIVSKFGEFFAKQG